MALSDFQLEAFKPNREVKVTVLELAIAVMPRMLVVMSEPLYF